jgi:hypothetical protein
MSVAAHRILPYAAEDTRRSDRNQNLGPSRHPMAPGLSATLPQWIDPRRLHSGTMPSDSTLLRVNERDRDNTESHNQSKTPLGDTMPARFLHPATEKAHSERNPAWR